MSIKLFITGTDTHIGKTYTSVGLLRLFNNHGYSTLGIKPVATGIMNNSNRLNEDVIALHKNSSVKLDYHLINAFTFQTPIEPHLAAQQEKINLSTATIIDKISVALNHPAQIKIIEGVGGWHVPLNETEMMEELVRILALDVILVVGVRLGCLNHTLLSAQAMQTSGVKLVGWVANCIDPSMTFQQENIDTLKKRLTAPCLGIIPYCEEQEHYLTIEKLQL